MLLPAFVVCKTFLIKLFMVAWLYFLLMINVAYAGTKADNSKMQYLCATTSEELKMI